jgi:hypothetical protein
MRPLGCP